MRGQPGQPKLEQGGTCGGDGVLHGPSCPGG